VHYSVSIEHIEERSLTMARANIWNKESVSNKRITYKLCWMLDEVGKKICDHVCSECCTDSGEQRTDTRGRRRNGVTDRNACGHGATTKGKRNLLPRLNEHDDGVLWAGCLRRCVLQ
jgi:hypothetical protein